MKRALLVVATVLAGVAVWAAGRGAAHATAPSSSSGASVTCYGKERWAVKTLADPASSAVNLKAVKAGVADLWSLEPPADALPLRDKRAAPWELTTYRVTAKLVQARFVDDQPKANGKGGGDRDYHLVIAAPSDPSKTMVVEFPDPQCVPAATASVPRARMTRARERFETLCGHAPRHSFYDLHGTATITGVGFFDRPHATGHALHGFELHPVLGFRSSNCVWGGKTKKT